MIESNRRANFFFPPVSTNFRRRRPRQSRRPLTLEPTPTTYPPADIRKRRSLPISVTTLQLPPAQIAPPYTYDFAEKTQVMSPSRSDNDMDNEREGIMESTIVVEAGPTVQSREEYEQETKELVKYLCDLDSGLVCLLDKVKQDMQHVKDVMTFLKKRAQIEEEYGKQIIKLSQQMAESFEKSHPRAGTFGEAWIGMLKVHEQLGEGRVRFGGEVAEVSDDLGLLLKDTEKSRKQLKTTGLKHEQHLQDTELSLEKAKQNYEKRSEEWETSIMMKNGDPAGSRRGRGMFKQAKTPAQLERAEEESRMKAAVSNENYKSQLIVTNDRRHEYYNTHLPKILTQLKESGDECNANLRYQLSRYSYIFEQAITSDGYTLDNDDGLGLRSLAERMDKEADLKLWVKSYGGKAGRAQKGDIPYMEYQMSHTSIASPPVSTVPRPLFGVDLAEQMYRDGDEVPGILIRCARSIEKYGLNANGIYRVSGTTAMVQKLRAQFDKGVDAVDLESEEIISDIHNVAGVLKLWFRELPDPLFHKTAYANFIDAARIDDPRHRVITLHDNVNKLPDPNYATLKYLMCHLDKVHQNQRVNKMGVQNLAIVWGPTLMGGNDGDMSKVLDMEAQVRCVETILENYRVIFEPDEE